VGGHAKSSGPFIDCVEYSMYHTRVSSGKVSVELLKQSLILATEGFAEHLFF